MDEPARLVDREMLFGAGTPKLMRKARKESESNKDNGEEEEIAVGRIEELLGLAGEDAADELSILDNLDITNEKSDTGDDLAQFASFLREGRVKKAVSEGVDLREYASQIEAELLVAHDECVSAYMGEASSFATLYRQITDCDEILERMENLLGGFQADLGNISREIKNLQDQSASMSVQLKNRRGVEERLSGFIDEAIIPKSVVDGITQASVDEAYIGHLKVLDEKLNFTERARLQYGNIKAADDVERLLEQLKYRGVTRTRTHLLQAIHQLRKPKSNVQVKQQTGLLKMRYLYTFLQLHAPDTAKEISDTYVSTISRIYTSYFKSYVSDLSKLIEDAVGKDDMIGAPEDVGGGSGGFVGFFTGRKKKATRSNVFALGMRAKLLDDVHAPSIVPHAAKARLRSPRAPGGASPAPSERYDYPKVFRSILHLLVDTMTNEHRFLLGFFGSECDVLFARVLEGSTRIVGASLAAHVEGTCDTIGVMLLLHIVTQHQRVMEHERNIRVEHMTTWYAHQTRVLAHRFRVLLRMNADSLKQATPISLGGVKDTRPHYVTRRYAEFVVALRTLKPECGAEEVVASALGSLRSAMENLLGLLARELSSMANVFLINNYDMLLSVLKERGLSGAEESTRFGNALDARIAAFVQATLDRRYRDMRRMVESSKKAQEEGIGAIQTDEKEVGKLIAHFSNSWKRTINEIVTEFRTLFFNFTTGEEILQLALGRLAEMYKAFCSIVKSNHRSMAKDLVPIPTITHLLTRSTTLT